MRLSELLIATLREDPADAEIVSHRLLLRGGYIVRVAAGLYTYSPLMWRTLRKLTRIVREELNRQGAQELMMPMMQPRELWERSGRWDRYVADGIMFTLKDAKNADMCLGPTHEEVITAYVDQCISSYKQLPVNLYQIQDKFRDEIRPRYGLMRGREFLMMDAYSFDIDQAGLDAAYAKMAIAYRNIFERCDLDFRAVMADSGAIGGSGSEEFMVVAEVGEDAILYSEESGYAANVERADSLVDLPEDNGDPRPLEEYETPGIKTVDQLVDFFDRPSSSIGKTILYSAVYADREELVAVMIRGDLVINEAKLVNALNALTVHLAADDVVATATGAEIGFAGPVGLAPNMKLLADVTLRGQTNLITGCNRTNRHCVNVNPGRDFPEPEWIDLRMARSGEPSPDGKGVLKEARGIEVGHIFKLGTKYSSAMNATFTAENGKPSPFVMGCYGIGVSRTAQAAVEQNHDERGIIWPVAIAPFEVVVAVVDRKNTDQHALAERIVEELAAAGADVCFDDRAIRPGAKFKDLELLGFPVQITIGRGAKDGKVEFVPRRTADKEEVDANEIAAKTLAYLQNIRGPAATQL